ncbi:hypothetical protein [Photobacterium damselae]|uniref:hypothetical protein n=1 Tax=Photobacterium damselae TaxID=38293 RepID=UPI00406967CB
MDKNLYQKQYDFELEQRNSLASGTNIPIVALTIIGGALSTMVTGFEYKADAWTYCFLTFVSLSIISVLVSLYKTVRSFLGYSYQKIPPAQAMKEHLEALAEWHKEQGLDEETATRNAQTDFEEYFFERLSEAAESNGSNNIKRGNYLHDATAFVVVAFVFMALSSPIFVYKNITKDTKPTKVQLLKEFPLQKVNIQMTTNNQDSSKPSGTSSESPKPTAAPISAKPTGPKNTVFKGNSDDGNKVTTDQPPTHKK